MITIRQYSPLDLPLLNRWYERVGVFGISENLLPSTTYILENNGKPVIAHSLVCTNVKEYAYLEGFISDVDYRAPDRDELVRYMVNFMKDLGKSLGYRRLLTIAPNEKLRQRYIELGGKATMENVTTVVVEL